MSHSFFVGAGGWPDSVWTHAVWTHPFWAPAARLLCLGAGLVCVLVAGLLVSERWMRPASAAARYRLSLWTLGVIAVAPLLAGALCGRGSTITNNDPAIDAGGTLAAATDREDESDEFEPSREAETDELVESPRPPLVASTGGLADAFTVASNDRSVAFAESDDRLSDTARAVQPLSESRHANGNPPELSQAGATEERNASSAWSGLRLPTIIVPAWLPAALVAGWLIGVGLCLARLGLGVWSMRRWIETGVPLMGTSRALARRIAARLGFASAPPIHVTDRAAEPLAAGWLRPRVFLPASWMPSISPAGLEAVLAHELVHIRRGDLWVNLVQRLIEAVWFFHPAVWWLTRRVRKDRELCCDAEAVEATGKPWDYAAALEFVATRALAARRPGGATGMGDESMNLLRRVKAVLGTTSEQPLVSWWRIGLLSAAAPVGLWLAGAAYVPATAEDEFSPAANRDVSRDDLLAFADEDDEERPEGPRREGDRPPPPRDGGPRPEGREGDRPPPPRDGERRPEGGPRREGDRGPEGRPGDRPPPPRDGERRPEGDRRREGDRGPEGRPGDRPPPRDGERRDGERREGDRRDGDRGPPRDGERRGPGPEQGELMRLIHELRAELSELRREVRELREGRGGRGPMGMPRDGERRPEGGPRDDFRRPDGGPRPEGGPRRDGDRGPPEGRGPRDGDRRPDGPPPDRRRDAERRPEGDRRPEGERKVDGEQNKPADKPTEGKAEEKKTEEKAAEEKKDEAKADEKKAE